MRSNVKPQSKCCGIQDQLNWDRQKKEYGQTKLVINALMEEIINLTTVRR